MQQYIIRYKMESKGHELSSKPHMISLSSNNDRPPVTKIFTPRHCTSLYLSTLHFFQFKFHPNTLHSTSLHLSTLHFFQLKLHPTKLH